MNLRKIGVVLLALLLAGMAMVPVVSAAEQNSATVSPDQMSAPTIDVNTIVLPQLQFEKSQNIVVVNHELSPDKNSESSASVRSPSGSQNQEISKIPFGSIIYHSRNGITSVFDFVRKTALCGG